MSDFNFWRHCWLTLKNSKPRLRGFMDKIEIQIEDASKFSDKIATKKELTANATNSDTDDPDKDFVQV